MIDFRGLYYYFIHGWFEVYGDMTKYDKCIYFCRRLQPSTILTGFIAALTWLLELLLYAYPCTTITTSSDLEIVDVWWISQFKCSFRIKAISPKLGSDTWHNIIYTWQNNFKSSPTTQNWRKLQHATILSCWRHFCMLHLSKNSYLMIPHTNFDIFDDSAYKFWRMIAQWKRCHPHTLLLLAYLKIFAKKIT